MKYCSECGRPYPPDFTIRGPVQRRLVDILSHHPEGLGRKEVMTLLYADDPNGGANNMNIVSVLSQHANRQLKSQGYKIVADLGRGALYRLVKLNAPAKRKPARNHDARAVERIESAINPGLDR